LHPVLVAEDQPAMRIRSTMRRLIATVGAVVVAFSLALVCGGPVAQSQALPTLRISGPPLDAYKTAYYAQSSGLFRKYGVNVELSTVASGTAAMAALAGGSVDLAFTAILPVIQAHVKGIEFQIVAPAGWYLSDAPQLLMLVRKDSTIAGGRDLNGKTIGCTALKDLSCTAMAAWIDQNGGDSKAVHTLELPNAALLPALDEGRIDAATFVTPFLDQALASGKARVLSKDYDAISKRFQTAGYVATADFAAKNADALRRFARAMHDAAVYTNAHLAETVDIVAAYSGIPAAAIAKSVRATDPENVDPRNIQPLIDVSAKYGIIDRGFPADEIISAAAVRPAR
jgi:NitT/TauT family transport system substrate-binding protein